MSHIVQIQTQVTDEVAVQTACQRLSLPAATRGTFRLFGQTVTGLGVQFPQWKYPVVCNTDDGSLQYDNYLGRWGSPQDLDRFLQRYAVEKTILEARRKGYSVSEQFLPNGSIKLTVQLGGGQ